MTKRKKKLLFIFICMLFLLIVGSQNEKEEVVETSIIVHDVNEVKASRGSDVKRELYLDIPLTEELQWFTENQSNYIGIPYGLTLAVMDIESGFNPTAISKTNDYGIMQINASNFAELRKIFPYTEIDLLSERDNIVCGTYLLGLPYHKYDGDLNKTLMVYNMGEPKAKEYWNKGIYETDYTRKVVEKFETYDRATKDSGR